MLLNVLLPLTGDEISSFFCQSLSAVISRVHVSCCLRTEIKRESSLLRLAASTPSPALGLLGAWRRGGRVSRAERVRKLNFLLPSQLLLRRLGGLWK